MQEQIYDMVVIGSGPSAGNFLFIPQKMAFQLHWSNRSWSEGIVRTGRVFQARHYSDLLRRWKKRDRSKVRGRRSLETSILNLSSNGAILSSIIGMIII